MCEGEGSHMKRSIALFRKFALKLCPPSLSLYVSWQYGGTWHRNRNKAGWGHAIKSKISIPVRKEALKFTSS